MGDGDPLGLTPSQRAESALHERAKVDPADVHVMWIRADPDGARVTDRGRYCPAAVPCLGRPAVGIVVPVRSNTGPHDRGGPVIDEIPATYCPRCKGWKADAREPC